jgi:transcriptional regulator EpsA
MRIDRPVGTAWDSDALARKASRPSSPYVDRIDADAPPMARPAPLAASDSNTLVAALVEAVAVRRRFQFFSWTQGHLQSLLPHGVLVCGLPRGSGTGMFFDYFHNLPLPTQTLSRLCHPRDGVAVGMLEVWRDQGSEPLAIHPAVPATASLQLQLKELGLGSTLVHGIPFEQSGVGAHGFFAFVSLRNVPAAREVNLVSMVVPFLFSTYCRALARDRTPSAVMESGGDGALSDREVEILHWVREGKSNHEIGMVLSISPLTVKNHIQRILKKLQASNRTQAVSKAVAMRLLTGSPAAYAGVHASSV